MGIFRFFTVLFKVEERFGRNAVAYPDRGFLLGVEIIENRAHFPFQMDTVVHDDIRFVHGVHITGTGLVKMRIHTGFHEAGYFHFIPADLPGEVGEHRRGGDDFHFAGRIGSGCRFSTA